MHPSVYPSIHPFIHPSIHPSIPSTRPGEKTVTIMDMRGLTFFKASNLYYLRLARWYAHVSHRVIGRPV